MSDLIAYKSNKLVEASYKLSLQEQRLLLLCISKIDSKEDAPPPEDQRKMTVTAEELLTNFPDIGKQNVHMVLKECIDRLWHRSVIVWHEERREEFRWIYYRASYLKDEGTAVITFAPEVMPYLTSLKGQFTRLVVKHLSNLTSSNSIRVYEILAKVKHVAMNNVRDRSEVIEVSDFRSMLRLDNAYSEFRELKRALITPALKEINQKTDLSVSFETVKTGRKVTGLKFTFEK